MSPHRIGHTTILGNRLDKWYIKRVPRSPLIGGLPFEWLLQFPIHRRRWWNQTSDMAVIVTAFNSFEAARAYLLRVEAHFGGAA